MARKKNCKFAPSSSIDDREKQLVSLAVDLAEKKLLDGTASSEIITHYLKLGSTRMELEKEKLRKENDLLEAKTSAIKSMERSEELYQRAIDAMKNYSSSNYD